MSKMVDYTGTELSTHLYNIPDHLIDYIFNSIEPKKRKSYAEEGLRFALIVNSTDSETTPMLKHYFEKNGVNVDCYLACAQDEVEDGTYVNNFDLERKVKMGEFNKTVRAVYDAEDKSYVDVEFNYKGILPSLLAVSEEDRYDAVIVAGGDKNVSDLEKKEWGKNEMYFMKHVDKPLLATCLGHQILAAAYGGRVLPSEDKVRVVGANLVDMDNTDPLFDGLSRFAFYAEEHMDHVYFSEKELDDLNIHNIAKSGKSEVEALRYNDGKAPKWGVQFHPEWGELLKCLHFIDNDAGFKVLDNMINLSLEFRDKGKIK